MMTMVVTSVELQCACANMEQPVKGDPMPRVDL